MQNVTTVQTAADALHPEGSEPAHEWRTPVERVAAVFVRGDHGFAALPTAVSAAARRIDTNRPARSIGTVVQVLGAADVREGAMNDEALRRWASLVHVVAILAGTGGRPIASRKRAAGRVLAAAGYSETRFARLLTTRDESLRAQMARAARYLAAAGGVPLDLRTLAELVLHDGLDERRADEARFALARGFHGHAGRDTESAPASDDHSTETDDVTDD